MSYGYRNKFGHPSIDVDAPADEDEAAAIAAQEEAERLAVEQAAQAEAERLEAERRAAATGQQAAGE